MNRLDSRSPRQDEEGSSWPVAAGSIASTNKVKETMTETPVDNTKVVRDMQIVNKMGLHARPAMQFVDLANKFTSRITVCKKAQCVNAKSIMELLLLAATAGTVLTVRAEGSDAEQAVDALAKLVAGKFGEE
jgi:phosphocarrier protein